MCNICIHVVLVRRICGNCYCVCFNINVIIDFFYDHNDVKLLYITSLITL